MGEDAMAHDVFAYMLHWMYVCLGCLDVLCSECVRACVRACVHVSVCVCVRACMRAL